MSTELVPILRAVETPEFFELEIPIAETTLAAIIASANLHPYEVVGVVRHAHLIGLRISHPESGFANVGHQDVFKTRDGRSRPSSAAMNCEARRSSFSDTPV